LPWDAYYPAETADVAILANGKIPASKKPHKDEVFEGI
jgi:hypothetical protein